MDFARGPAAVTRQKNAALQLWDFVSPHTGGNHPGSLQVRRTENVATCHSLKEDENFHHLLIFLGGR